MEAPFIDPTIEPRTALLPVITTDTIEVHKEKEAFPFSSLVADCGGVLGLFIGLNFLMIWDLMIQCYGMVRYLCIFAIRKDRF